MMAESGSGISSTIDRRNRLTRDVAVDPLQRIDGSKREHAGKHFVQHDAQRVEIASGIDRPIHSPGLFRRHIGKRSGDNLRRRGRLPLAWQARGEAKAGQPGIAPRGVRDDVRRLDVAVEELSCVEAAQRLGDGDGQP